jgi:hypothetical protein
MLDAYHGTILCGRHAEEHSSVWSNLASLEESKIVLGHWILGEKNLTGEKAQAHLDHAKKLLLTRRMARQADRSLPPTKAISDLRPKQQSQAMKYTYFLVATPHYPYVHSRAIGITLSVNAMFMG